MDIKNSPEAHEALNRTNNAVRKLLHYGIIGKVSDGYHTFDELYEFRKLYNAALFNVWATQVNTDLNHKFEIVETVKYHVHKSWKHHDGELCFGGGWFIVVAMLPTGQISNHYPAEDWELFKIPEAERALFPYDGHTGADTTERLKALLLQ